MLSLPVSLQGDCVILHWYKLMN